MLLACQESDFDILKVSGNIKNTSNKNIKLISFSENNVAIILDTATLSRRGKYLLNTIYKPDELLAIQVDNETPVWFVPDSKEIEINVDYHNYKKYSIKNSTASMQLHDFINNLDSLTQLQISKIVVIDSLRKNKFADSVINLYKQDVKLFSKQISTFCTKSISNARHPAIKYFYLYYSLKSKALDENQVFKHLSFASDSFPNHKQLLGLKNSLDLIVKSNPKLFLINSVAPDFSIIDSNKTTVTYNTFKNKVLLLNFTSTSTSSSYTNSLLNIYKEFKSKNFEILGISLDTSKQIWLSSIKKDSIMWQQVLDTTSFKSIIAKKYYVNTTPFTILINANKKIVAVDIKGEALRDKLKEIIK